MAVNEHDSGTLPQARVRDSIRPQIFPVDHAFLQHLQELGTLLVDFGSQHRVLDIRSYFLHSTLGSYRELHEYCWNSSVPFWGDLELQDSPHSQQFALSWWN